MSKSYLILGASGFIGRNIVEHLIAGDNIVHAFDKVTTRKFFSSGNVIHVDFCDFDADMILEYIADNQIDVVVHLISGLLPASSIDDFFIENEKVIVPTYKIIDGLKLGKTKFVYFSSGGTVYGNKTTPELSEMLDCSPISYYGYSKLLIEKFILATASQSALKYLILRPSNPYGRYQNINGKQGIIAVTIGRILNGQDLEIWGDGEVVRDYIYIDDLCDVFFELMSKEIENHVLNVGSGEGCSLNLIIQTILNCCPLNLKQSVVYKPARKIDVQRAVLDISSLRSLIDYNPTPIAMGINEFVCFSRYENQINKI